MDIEKQAENDRGIIEENKIECRACLQIFDDKVEECLFNLYQAWTPPWDGMGSTIAEVLAKMANITILETDKHSKVICETCYQKLREACVFATCVYNNDLLLRQRYSEETQDIDKEWPKPIQITSINGVVFDNSMNVEIKQEVLSDEEYGNTNGMNEDYLDLDIKIEPEEIIEQKPIQITAVNGTLLHSPGDMDTAFTNRTIELHGQSLEAEIKEEPLSEEDDAEPMGDLSLECMLCTKSFNSVSGLKSHVITQHSYKSVKRKTDSKPSPQKVVRSHSCTTCRRRFATSTDLLVHETCHNQYTCYGCGDKFDTFSLLAKHRKKCLKSTVNTVTHKSLDDVKRIKVQPKDEVETLKCTKCNQEFSDPYYMSVHMEVHQPSETMPVEGDLKPTAMDTQNLEDIFNDAT